MGIDAEMLIRKVPATRVTEKWLKQLSWRLCESIGANNFFISDGLPPAEYEPANRAWHDAFDSHPLHPEWNALANKPADPGKFWATLSPAEEERKKDLHAQILRDLGKSPEQQRLAIEPALWRYREDDDPPPGSEYREDSDTPVKAQNGECLLQVNLYGRYYGPGYERGDILTYCAIAEWLELNLPGCEIWYGGDSSGVCAEPFTEAKRRELRNHLYGSEGRAYFQRDWMRGQMCPAPCSLCPNGQYLGSQFGSGRNGLYGAFHCAGCGKSVKTEDGGQSWSEHKDGE